MSDPLSFTLVRSIVVTAPLIVLSTSFFGLISFVWSFFDKTGDAMTRVSRMWARSICWIAGIKLEVEGLEKIDLTKHYIFTSNHLSYMDTPVVLASIPLEFRFMAKQELFEIPFLGTHLKRAGHISVPLEDPRASIRALSHAARIINERKISVLIFPEGGRSEDGELQPFKEGAAYTAIKGGVTVVPVGLCGTRQVLKMHSLNVRGGKVKVRIGDPIDTSNMKLQDRTPLTEQIREQIVALSCPSKP